MNNWRTLSTNHDGSWRDGNEERTEIIKWMVRAMQNDIWVFHVQASTSLVGDYVLHFAFRWCRATSRWLSSRYAPSFRIILSCYFKRFIQMAERVRSPTTPLASIAPSRRWIIQKLRPKLAELPLFRAWLKRRLRQPWHGWGEVITDY